MSCEIDYNRIFKYVVPTFDPGNIIIDEEEQRSISMISCNPNYYNQSVFADMIFGIYHKLNARIYHFTYGCNYSMEENLISTIINAVLSGASLGQILNAILELILRHVREELKSFLYYHLSKLINSLSFSSTRLEYQFIKVIYNPSMPYGFYISITSPISRRYKDKIKSKLIEIYNKVVAKRIKVPNIRLVPPGKIGRLMTRFGVDRIIQDQINSFINLANRKAIDYIEKGVESTANAAELAIKKFVEKHLSKVAKYEPVEEHHINLPSDPDQSKVVPYELGYDPDSIIKATPLTYTISTVPLGIFYPTKFISHAVEDLTWIKKQYETYGAEQTSSPSSVSVHGVSSSYNLLPQQDIVASVIPTSQDILNLFEKTREGYISRIKKSSDFYNASVNKGRIDLLKKSSNELKDSFGLSYIATKGVHDKYLENIRATPFTLYDSKSSTTTGLNYRDASDIITPIDFLFYNSIATIEDTYSISLFARLSGKIYLNVFDSILSMPVYSISVKQLMDDSEDGETKIYSTWLPAMAAYYVLNHVGERHILKDGKIVRVDINPDEFYLWVQTKLMENPKFYGKKPFIEMFTLYVKERYNIQSYAEYVDQTIEEIKRDINPYKYAITAHLIKKYEKETDPGQKLVEGENIFRIISNALAPLDQQTYDFITHPVDFEAFKGNHVDSNFAYLGQRMAESMLLNRLKDLKAKENYESRYINESEFLMNLINPALFYVLNSHEILYNYLSSIDMSAQSYVLASLEPTTKYFDPLPRRFVYNMSKDKEAIEFFRRRNLLSKLKVQRSNTDPSLLETIDELDNLRLFYNTELAVFTDILPLKSLVVEYEDIETDQVGSFFKIDIPIRWNMYQPIIRMEVYDNAYRDLYNYFLRYKKIAFYKSVARPAFDISFILDIITLNADLALQNIVSYIVVPKSIDMKYIEYTEQFTDEVHVITFEFSVIGFVYYTSTGIGSLKTAGLQGTYHHLPGSFIELDDMPSNISSKHFIENSYEAMIYHARNAVLNWYGVYNLNPVSVLVDDEKYASPSTTSDLAPLINLSENPIDYEKRYWGSFSSMIRNELHKNISYNQKYYRTRGYYTIGSHVIKR